MIESGCREGDTRELSFRLRVSERVGPAMRRALSADLRGSAALLDGGPGSLEERIHKVRRRLKRDRSLTGVFAPAAPKLSRQIRLKLRNAGRALASLRESHALAEAAASLGKQLDAQSEAIVAAAATTAAMSGAGEDRQMIRSAIALIEEAALLVDRLPKRRGRRLLDRALARAHRRVRKARKTASRSGATEDLHEWRKELKDLTHLARFAERRLRSGGRIGDWAREAEQLLGDDHDLAILRSRVVKKGKTAAARFVSNIEIGGRRAKLQRRAYRLGRRIGRAPAPQLR
jgi:CHAD domain-containing protein